MRTPISISHEKQYYRVIFASLDPHAIIPMDDAREWQTLSRTHVLRSGKRDYDALAESESDAMAVARNYLAWDRRLDGTREIDWRVDGIIKY